MQLLTIDDVAAHWCLRPQTVRAMIRAGTLRAARIARQYRLHWSDVWACEEGLRPTGATWARYATALLTQADLVALTRTSERTVERWIGAGLPTRNVGTNVRINREDARDWLCRRYGIDIGATSATATVAPGTGSIADPSPPRLRAADPVDDVAQAGRSAGLR